MGLYLEARDKVQWLEEHGDEHGNVYNALKHVTDDEFVVCLVNNGAFYAAAIAYNDGEVEAFNLPTDPRPKRWFIVTKEKLRHVCPAWDTYVKE